MWATAKRRLGAIATIAGVLFVGYQYFDGKWKARIERSLHYILIYQESDKVAARNEIDLQPSNGRPRDFELDPIALEKLKELQGASDPDCVEKYVSASVAGFAGKPSLDIKNKISDFWETACNAQFVKNLAYKMGTSDRELPSNVKCRDRIYKFAEQRILKIAKNPKHLTEMKPGDSIEIDNRIVKKFDDDRLWWFEKGSTYYYAWPDLTWKFFYTQQRDVEGVAECSKFLNDYEVTLGAKSTNILKSLHELKHFYAAMSICTTSRLCDSYVACEAFNTDVGNFLGDWKEYLELWSAKEAESEYYRLQAFVSHCKSNIAFMNHSITQEDSRILDIQGFLNWW